MADQGDEGLLSPWLRRRRIQAALPWLHGTVLDVGCGSGELAAHVPCERYLGFDIDDASLAIARRKWPAHRFVAELPSADRQFDTIVSLAVVEHVADPGGFLAELRDRLRPTATGAIVCTTPHPAVDRVHTVGAAIGLFSGHASEEHESLLDRAALARAGEACGLALAAYRRFLCGANQLAVFRPADGLK